jgi:hypothetical protein
MGADEPLGKAVAVSQMSNVFWWVVGGGVGSIHPRNQVADTVSRRLEVRWWLLQCSICMPSLYHVCDNPVCGQAVRGATQRGFRWHFRFCNGSSGVIIRLIAFFAICGILMARKEL